MSRREDASVSSRHTARVRHGERVIGLDCIQRTKWLLGLCPTPPNNFETQKNKIDSLETVLQREMSILQYNGAAMIAMAGKNCVGICSDTRLGVQAQTVAKDFEKIFSITDSCYVGLAGLATDVISVQQLLKFRCKLFELRENREIPVETFSALLSTILYEKRFGPWFCEPIVAGLKEDNTPFLSGMDLIGAPVFTNDFVVSGTCTANLHGMCEALYKPNMEPDELFEVLSQCLLAAVDRDALSGWGAVVHIITKDGTISRKLKCRQD